MRPSEKAVDERYRAEGWYDFSNGWPDRAYVRIKSDGTLEVKFVEIKSPGDRLRTDQELTHAVLLSQGVKVEIEPASKAPKVPTLPLDVMLKAIQLLEKNRKLSK
jgi:hypothetical protein